MTEPVIGWDLGGAHLKAARLTAAGPEAVVQHPCPLWQGLTHLETAARDALVALGPATTHAITMTGEMVDLFATREEGVARILAAIGALLPGATLRIWAGPAGFLPPEEAVRRPGEVASANWLATAAWVARTLPAALLVDIGSTTTDLVPVAAGTVRAAGRGDFERLTLGELVYTGVARTPVMALTPAVTFEGRRVPLVAEYFATSADIYRLTGELPDDADLHPAADHGEKTVGGSARRLARMIGRDAGSAAPERWRELALALREAQVAQLLQAFDRVVARGGIGAEAPVVAAGAGRFLVADLAARRGRAFRSFADLVPPGAVPAARGETCAPAVAVAALALAR